MSNRGGQVGRLWGIDANGQWREQAVGRMRHVPTLSINDPEIYALAKYMALHRRTSLTDAVRGALQEAVTREAAARQAAAREAAAREAEAREAAAREAGPDAPTGPWFGWLQ